MHPHSAHVRSAGGVALLFGLLMFVPIVGLGVAIGWPASLDEPAEVLMPLILEQEVSVRLGYLAYLVYSLLFFPAIALLGRLLGDTTASRMAVVFAGLSALARSIGILRWLTVLPALALAYRENRDDAIPAVFDAINEYGGAIGELLGVSVFGAAAIALLSWRMIGSRELPRWLGFFGMVAAAGLLLPWIEVFGVDVGAFLSVSVTIVQLWFLTVGVVLLTRKDARVNTTRGNSSGSEARA